MHYQEELGQSLAPENRWLDRIFAHGPRIGANGYFADAVVGWIMLTGWGFRSASGC
jgi:hypothetical protein